MASFVIGKEDKQGCQISILAKEFFFNYLLFRVACVDNFKKQLYPEREN